MTNQELEACPFCGGKGKIKKTLDNNYYPACLTSDCPAINMVEDIEEGIMISFKTREAAIKAWNTRSSVSGEWEKEFDEFWDQTFGCEACDYEKCKTRYSIKIKSFIRGLLGEKGKE